MNVQCCFPLGLTGMISKGLTRIFSSTTVRKHYSLVPSLLYGSILTSVNDFWKNVTLPIWTFVSKLMSLFFSTMSRLVMAFFPWSKNFNFMSAVTIHSDFGAHKNKICHSFHFSPFICQEVMRLDDMILYIYIYIYIIIFNIMFQVHSKVTELYKYIYS